MSSDQEETTSSSAATTTPTSLGGNLVTNASAEQALLLQALPHQNELQTFPSSTLREMLQARQNQQGIWEGDLASAMATLQTQKNVGLREQLTDGEGFPRDDIDVIAVRHARNTVVSRQNDLKRLGEDLKILVEATFAAISREQQQSDSTLDAIEAQNIKRFEERRRKREQERANNNNNIAENDEDVKRTMKAIMQDRQENMNRLWLDEAGVVPVCIVSEVLPNSPAFLAGFLDGDSIVAVGEERGSEGHLQPEDSIQPMLSLKDFAGVIRNSEGKQLRVMVERKDKENKKAKNIVELHLVPKKWSGNGILGCGLDAV